MGFNVIRTSEKMITLRNLRWIFLGAIIIGLGCAAFFQAVYHSRLLPPSIRYFDFWIPLVVVFFMIILIRGQKEERTFHFWEGLAAGNMMIWLGGLFSGLGIYGLALVDPISFQHFLESGIKFLKINEKPGPQLDESIKILQNQVPSSMIWVEFKIKLFYSFILVPLVSMIFRRK
jgi:hypothetical protein